MTREIKDGFVVRDRRYWVDDEERDAEEQRAKSAPASQQQAVDTETLRTALVELEDSKHRLRREADRQLEVQRGQVLEALLPVLDNLERTLTSGQGAKGVEGVLEGVRLVHAQFLSALRDFGLERRSAVGERFDPRVHDAV